MGGKRPRISGSNAKNSKRALASSAPLAAPTPKRTKGGEVVGDSPEASGVQPGSNSNDSHHQGIGAESEHEVEDEVEEIDADKLTVETAHHHQGIGAEQTGNGDEVEEIDADELKRTVETALRNLSERVVGERSGRTQASASSASTSGDETLEPEDVSDSVQADYAVLADLMKRDGDDDVDQNEARRKSSETGTDDAGTPRTQSDDYLKRCRATRGDTVGVYFSTRPMLPWPSLALRASLARQLAELGRRLALFCINGAGLPGWTPTDETEAQFWNAEIRRVDKMNDAQRVRCFLENNKMRHKLLMDSMGVPEDRAVRDAYTYGAVKGEGFEIVVAHKFPPGTVLFIRDYRERGTTMKFKRVIVESVGTDLARRALARPDALMLTLTLAPRVARSLARCSSRITLRPPRGSASARITETD